MFGRTPLGNRRVVHGVVGYACSPTMQTPSPTQKPLAGMHASAAAAERVFSAQPIVQETESARGTDEKDEVYGGLLLKATPPKKSVRSPGLLDATRRLVARNSGSRAGTARARRRARCCCHRGSKTEQESRQTEAATC